MAEIEYVTGNLLDSPEMVIIHGRNAQGHMGSGIAKEIRARCPWAYDAYRKHYEDHLGENLMGTIAWALGELDGREIMIGNAITQRFKGRDPIRYCDYEAIARVMEQVNEFARSEHIPSIGMPLIGAGLANGSWKIISAIIEATATAYQPRVYLLEGMTVPAT